ncbi:MAG: PEP-CTERM sorting domain-containing protein [Pirellula sp.]
MRSLILVFLTITVLAIGNGSLHAAFMFAGNHTLVANQANQVINIFASSATGEVAPGFNLNFVIDDGGSIVGGVDNNTPKITSINLKPTAGLFAGIPDIQFNALSSQKLFQVTIAPTNIANRPTISTNSLLAQVTLDTTGLTSGTWVLDLDGLPSKGLPSSDFAGLATTVTNGSVNITAVPEPSGVLTLCLVGGCALLARFRRRLPRDSTTFFIG